MRRYVKLKKGDIVIRLPWHISDVQNGVQTGVVTDIRGRTYVTVDLGGRNPIEIGRDYVVPDTIGGRQLWALAIERIETDNEFYKARAAALAPVEAKYQPTIDDIHARIRDAHAKMMAGG